MRRVFCARCRSFLVRTTAQPGQRLEFSRCPHCQRWPLAFVDQAGDVHELAFLTREAMEDFGTVLAAGGRDG